MSHTFNDAFDILLKMQSAQSRNTFAQARCVIAHLQPFFGSTSLEEFLENREELWAEYKTYCANQITPKGKRRRLTHDRRFLVQTLKRAENKGWVKRSFSKKDFPLKEAHEPIGQYIDDESVKRLLNALECHPKTRLQVMMAVYMGMRLSEILKLRVDEVNLDKREISLDPSRLKTRQPRKVPIPIANSVLPELVEYVHAAQGVYVFPMDRSPDEPQTDNRHWWNVARRAANVQCRFHDLRHTAVTNAVAKGIPTEWISKVFGATPQVLSRVYSHLREDDKEQFRSFLDGRFDQKPAGMFDGFKKRVFTTLRF